jgi:hypothetical protein
MFDIFCKLFPQKQLQMEKPWRCVHQDLFLSFLNLVWTAAIVLVSYLFLRLSRA